MDRAGQTMAAVVWSACALAACGGAEPVAVAPSSPPAETAEAVATASASAAPPAPEPAPPPRPGLVELIPAALKGMEEAFNLHDAKKLAAFYADDAVVSAYGAPDCHGRDDLARTMGDVFSAFGDAKSAPVRTWVKGNVVITETAWAGTMTGDFMGQKATRKPVGQIRASVLSFSADGLVKEAHEYGDDAGLMAQMAGKKGAPPVPILPANRSEIHASTGSAEEDRIAAWAKSQDDAFDTDDAAPVLAGVADDADYWIGISGKPATRGKKDLLRELKDWFRAFPDQKWTTTAAWGIDGFGIVEHTMTGTQKGRLGPLAASGKPVTSWHWLDIVQPSADGKLQRGWGHANLVELLKQTKK